MRRTSATYWALDATGAASTQVTDSQAWYRYDAANRVTTDGGLLQGGVIVGGIQHSYFADGRRATTEQTAQLSKRIWKLALSGIAGGVSAGVGATGLFGQTVNGAFQAGTLGINNAVLSAAAQAVTGNIITQGIAIATELQGKFDWAGVAAAGIGGGVARSINMTGVGGVIVSNMAGGIAGAAGVSLVTGDSFGDTLIRSLPSIIGNTIGNLVLGGLGAAFEPQRGGGEKSPRLPLTEYLEERGIPRIVQQRAWKAEFAGLDGSLQPLDVATKGGGLTPKYGSWYDFDRSGVLGYLVGGLNALVQTVTGRPSNEVLTDFQNTIVVVGRRAAANAARTYDNIRSGQVLRDWWAVEARQENMNRLIIAQVGGRQADVAIYATREQQYNAATKAAADHIADTISRARTGDPLAITDIAYVAAETYALGAVGSKIGGRFNVGPVKSGDTLLLERGVTDAGLRQSILDTGFNPAILGDASQFTLNRFDKLFQRTFDANKAFRGRLGNLSTRARTIETAVDIDRAGLIPDFERIVRLGEGRTRFVDVAGLDATRNPAAYYQLYREAADGMIPLREIDAANDILRVTRIRPVMIRTGP